MAVGQGGEALSMMKLGLDIAAAEVRSLPLAERLVF
jgi:hypothetical protein